MLRANDLAGPGTEKALVWLRNLFAAPASSSVIAATELVGGPPDHSCGLQ
jgi:hypothetical protein